MIDVESVQTGKGVAGEIRATYPYPIVLKEEEENRQIFLSRRKDTDEKLISYSVINILILLIFQHLHLKLHYA